MLNFCILELYFSVEEGDPPRSLNFWDDPLPLPLPQLPGYHWKVLKSTLLLMLAGKKLQVHQVTKSVIIKSARRTAAAAAAEGRSHST